jgi:HEAT repeat protein
MNAQLPQNDARGNEEIIAAALAPSCEPDSDEYWSAVRILQHRIEMPLIDRMRELIVHPDERHRILATDVIAQGRAKEKELSRVCVKLLLEVLNRERSPQVLSAICNALGHHESADATGPLSELQSHPDENVRLAVVHGLSCQDDPIAVASLISLSVDSDRDVRNWATFGLGSMTSVDSSALREALLARIKEPDEEISGEALVGLALRGDTRVALPLLEAINALHESQSGFGTLITDAVEASRVAAAKTPDDTWKPLLARCDELGLSKQIEQSPDGSCTPLTPDILSPPCALE